MLTKSQKPAYSVMTLPGLCLSLMTCESDNTETLRKQYMNYHTGKANTRRRISKRIHKVGRLRHLILPSASLILAGALGFGTPACAASFDCAHAPAADERAVCAHLELNDQDVRLSTLYRLDLRFLPMGGRDDLERTQVEWLRARSACGAKLPCLRAIYQKRITLLQDIIDTRVVTQGPF